MHYGPEIIRKAFRYRLCPTRAQAGAFLQISGCGRKVYNAALERERTARAEGSRLGYADHQKWLGKEMKKAHPFLKDVPHHTLQAALRDLEQANRRWASGQCEEPTFRRYSETPHLRFPDPGQFRLEHIPKKTFRDGLVLSRGAARGKARYLRAPKFGMRASDWGPIEIIMHRPLKGKIKTCTITREGDHWYASFSVEIRRKGVATEARNPTTERLVAVDPTLAEQPPAPGRKAAKSHRRDHRQAQAERRAKRNRSRAEQRRIVEMRAQAMPTATPEEIEALMAVRLAGGDLGVANPLTLSSGDILGRAALGKGDMRRLARLQRKVSRKEEALRARHGLAPGSSLKGLDLPKALLAARAAVRRFWGRIIRRRRDTAHKITSMLVKRLDVIVLEDLKTAAMTASARGSKEAPGSRVRQKAGLNRSILDRGWGELTSQLTYKMAWASRRRGAKKILLRVDPAYTSQTCHACKSVSKESRPRQALFACVACGHHDHADVNAACNIAERGLEEILRAFGLTFADITERGLAFPGASTFGSSAPYETAGGSPVAALGGIGRQAPETPLAGGEAKTDTSGRFHRLQGDRGETAPTN